MLNLNWLTWNCRAKRWRCPSVGLAPWCPRGLVGAIALGCCLLVGQDISSQERVRQIADWPMWLDDSEPGRPRSETAPHFDQAVDLQKRDVSTPGDRRSLRWTRTALDLIVQQRLNPLRAARVLAILHAAMQDALVRGVKQAGDERIAWIAVHRTASLVLADLFPEQAPERLQAAGLAAAAGVNGSSSPGGLAMWTIGGEVARSAAARARADGADRVWALDRRPPPAPGRWRPTPPINAANPLEPLGGEWRTWVLAHGGAVEPPDPVPYDSPRFWQEADEVRRVASSLTPAQKAVAETWNLDRGTVTPAGVWDLKAIELADNAGLDGPETVRMFAALDVAMMDAFIACWHAKFKWWTVRPITVIRDRYEPEFLTHLVTPNFPSYVSGHASASGAAETVLARFFPDKVEWLRAQAGEAAESRLLGGIHYRSDNEAGLELGREVGRQVIDRVFGQHPPER